MKDVKTARLGWLRWAALLALTAILAGCGPAVTPEPPGGAAPAPADPAPTPDQPQATCDDSAIRLLGRSAGIHGAIVADTLHMGGAAAPVTCAEPANLALLARLSIPDDWTAQVQQSQYYLIVIRYPGGNRLYVISRRSDGTSCVVDTNDRCIAQVTELPDGFDLDDLPDDVEPTIPAGRPAPEPPAATDTAPAAAGNPQPRDGATGVAVETLLLSWSAAARAASYDVYWGREEHLTADADLGTPIATTSTATTIRRPALGTTYYWRVDTKNDQGTTTGSVWSFTTADQAAPPPPVAPGGGYTPPVVSPPPAEETPPAGPPVAPAWPGGAQSFRWVVRQDNTPVSVAAPTGTPTPAVTLSILPRGMVIRLRDGYYHISDTLGLRRGEGEITFTATNSAGTAKKTVSYAVSCHSSDATIANWLKGSAWESEPSTSGVPAGFSRAVFNDTATALTLTLRTGGTEQLTGGVRHDSCFIIVANDTVTNSRGSVRPRWSFFWGSDFGCDGRLDIYRDDGSARELASLKAAACD